MLPKNNIQPIVIDSGEEDEVVEQAPKSQDKTKDPVVIDSSDDNENPASSSRPKKIEPPANPRLKNKRI